MTTYPLEIRTFIAGLILVIVILGSWEMYCRNMGYKPWIDNSKGLWAEQRAKAERAGKDDIVITGSSRALYDIQLDIWKEETGRRPIQLALEGSSPLPVIRDIVETSSFAGILIIGVTPTLFYSPPSEEFQMWRRPKSRVDHYHERTWADKLGHWLSIPLDKTFAFLETQDNPHYNLLDLRTLIYRIPLKERVPTHPPFPYFATVDRNRNVSMLERTVTDTAYAAQIKRVWGFYGQKMPPPPVFLELRPVITGMIAGLVKQFEARGGQVIFVRCPSQGPFYEGETMLTPRAEFWDTLLEATGAPGYHFEDYPFMNQYILPEWSHLSAADARTFTRDLVRQMKADGHIRS